MIGDLLFALFTDGAKGGSRTPTSYARWILNPVRLPIPPLSLEPNKNNQLWPYSQGRGCKQLTNIVTHTLSGTIFLSAQLV